MRWGLTTPCRRSKLNACGIGICFLLVVFRFPRFFFFRHRGSCAGWWRARSSRATRASTTSSRLSVSSRRPATGGQGSSFLNDFSILSFDTLRPSLYVYSFPAFSSNKPTAVLLVRQHTPQQVDCAPTCLDIHIYPTRSSVRRPCFENAKKALQT